MSSLAEHGFLSSEIKGVVEVVTRRYAAWLNLVRSINAHAVKAQYEANVHSRYLPELVAITVYMRTLTNVQAAVLLLLHGMDVPARIVLRAAMESLFKLKAVERDPNVVNAMLRADDDFREGFFKNLKEFDSPNVQAELELIAEQPPSEVSQQLKEWGVQKLSVKKMAERADLFDLYLTAYPMLSDSAHAGVRDLEQHHLETDGKGTILAAKNEPGVEDLELLFALAAEFLIIALEGHAKIFELDYAQACAQARKSLHTLKPDV
jgi:hypothetical protein